MPSEKKKDAGISGTCGGQKNQQVNVERPILITAYFGYERACVVPTKSTTALSGDGLDSRIISQHCVSH